MKTSAPRFALAVFLAWLTARAAASLSFLLQEAIYAEETDGGHRRWGQALTSQIEQPAVIRSPKPP